MSGTMPAGWYADPEGRASARWWDGVWWTAWESDGVQHRLGHPPSPARAATLHDLPALSFVRMSFLGEAQRRGVLQAPQADALARLTDQLAAEVVGPHAAPVVVPVPPAVPGAPATPAPTATTPRATTTPPVPPAPSASPVSATSPLPPLPPPPASRTGHASPRVNAPAQTPVPVPPAGWSPQMVRAPRTPPAPRTPRTPGRVSRWWRSSRLRLDTDLTVHGLTYLGVLLLFVGVFGLVAFAFGDVEPGLRPVAELAVTAVPFVAAWLLARSGARFVARAMVAVGALILPVMVVTSTVDGFGVPPDLRGYALPVGTGLACAAIAVAYAVHGWRRPGSALAVMAAPTAWFAAGMSAVALARPVPSGEDVAVPGAAQVAVIALAVLTTTWLATARLARSLPDRLAEGARAAAPAGVVIIAVLALVAWVAEGWPVVPVLVTTAALALTVARLRPHGGGDVLTGAWFVLLFRVLTIDSGTPVLSEHVPVPGAALDARPVLLLTVLLAGAVLLEVNLRRARTSATAFALLGWTVAVVVLLAALHVDGAPWGLLGAVALTVWAPVRRVSPPPLAGAGPALDAIAAVAPVALVVGVWQHVGGPAAGVLAALLTLSAAPLARGRLRRTPGDRLWLAWWAVMGTATVLASVALAADGLLGSASTLERLAGPVMLTLVLAAIVAGPGPRHVTVTLATPVTWWLWAAVVATTEWGAGALALGYALLGLGAVVVAHLGRRADVVSPAATGAATGAASSAPPAPSAASTAALPNEVAPRRRSTALAVAVAGYVTGCAAVLAVADNRAFAAVLGAGTLAWLVTAVLGDRGRSPVVAVLDRAGALRSLPWAIGLLGLPVTAVATLHAGGTVRLGDPWWSAPFVVSALGYAVSTRLRVPDRVRAVLPWTAFALAGLAVLAALAVDEPAPTAERGSWPLVVALTTLALTAPAVRARHAVLTWTSWLTLAPLTGIVAWTVFTRARELGGDVVTVGSLVGVGGLLAVGALLTDRAHPRAPRALPRRPAAVPPFLVGVSQLALGTVLAAMLASLAARTAAPVTTPVTAGVLLLAAAVLAGAVAGLGGVGAVGATAALVAWIGTRVLLADGWGGTWADAWGDVIVAGTLLLVALLASLARTPAARWARWDVPFSIAAGLPALVALTVAGAPERPAIFVVVGGMAIATAVRLHRRRVVSETIATVGSVLVLLGTAWASRGWAVLALAGLAAAHTALAALRETGTWRTARQWVGAVLAAAAWVVFVTGPTALGGSDQLRVDATALGASLVTLAVVAATATGRLDRSWCLPWGGVGALLTVTAGLAPVSGWEPRADAPDVGWWQVAAWSLLAVATALAGQISVYAAAQATGPITGQAAGHSTGQAGHEAVQSSAGHKTLDVAAWRTGWRVAAVGPLLAALLAGLASVSASSLTRVTVLAAVSLATAVVVVIAARADGGPTERRRAGRQSARTPLMVLGVATLVLAAWFALDAGATTSDGLPVPARALLSVVLAVAAVQAAAYGLALGELRLRLAAPVLAWLAWAVYATNALGGVLAWHTVPVGLAMLATVGVWRADRRRRGLPASEPGVAALDLAGIAFLVVASFVSAFTDSVLHALVAAAIGVGVFVWAVLTRVRRRLLAGAGIVLAGFVVAAVLPLVALVPRWGGAALWVAVAVVGLLVVLAATFLERGRAAVTAGRSRLRTATAGWE